MMTVQHTAITMQHTATHCNTLLSTSDTWRGYASEKRIMSVRSTKTAKIIQRMLHHCVAVVIGTLQHTATRCNTALYCSTLSPRRSSSTFYTATHCNTLQHTATHCNTLQYTATHCSKPQNTATPCNTLQHPATHCNTPQHTATHCNTLQHTATHCNTLQ